MSVSESSHKMNNWLQYHFCLKFITVLLEDETLVVTSLELNGSSVIQTVSCVTFLCLL